LFVPEKCARAEASKKLRKETRDDWSFACRKLMHKIAETRAAARGKNFRDEKKGSGWISLRKNPKPISMLEHVQRVKKLSQLVVRKPPPPKKEDDEDEGAPMVDPKLQQEEQPEEVGAKLAHIRKLGAARAKVYRLRHGYQGKGKKAKGKTKKGKAMKKTAKRGAAQTKKKTKAAGAVSAKVRGVKRKQKGHA